MKRTIGTSVMLPPGVTAEQFVEVWQQAKDVPEVCRTLGMTDRYDAATFAGYLRKKGVPLKVMRKARCFDIDALAEKARALAPKEKSDG